LEVESAIAKAKSKYGGLEAWIRAKKDKLSTRADQV